MISEGKTLTKEAFWFNIKANADRLLGSLEDDGTFSVLAPGHNMIEYGRLGDGKHRLTIVLGSHNYAACDFIWFDDSEATLLGGNIDKGMRDINVAPNFNPNLSPLGILYKAMNILVTKTDDVDFAVRVAKAMFDIDTDRILELI